MESSLNWEYKKLIDELTQGMEKAKQLRFHLCSTSPCEDRDLLMQRIISTFERAFLILKWSGSVGQARVGGAAPAALESSISVDGSVNMNKNFRDHCEHGDTSKKRKLQPIWTDQVRVNLENGLEGPTDDGYSWRKYGQKDILGAKYPRSYYRCTYRLIRNCWATKQVQRSDDDPTVFEITYKGTHTCNGSADAFPQRTSLENQELTHNNSYYHQVEQQNQTLLNIKTNLRVNTGDLDNTEMPSHFSFPSTYGFHEGENQYTPVSARADDNQLGTYSPLFYSPATSGSNYFSAAMHEMKNYGGTPMQHSETDIADVISGHTSTTNSPIGSIEFSIDPVDLDPNFPYNNPGFFT